MSTSSIAAQTLQHRIVSGAYSAGTMLPGQRELAESLGISRPSLREAMSTLEALGFVRSMPGKGTLVTRGAAAGAAAPSEPADTTSLQMLWQFRFCFEPASAALAARALRPAQTPRLWGPQARLEDAARSGDLVTAAAADLDFHRLIATLSGNPHLEHLMHSFDSEIGRAVQLPFVEADRIHAVVHEHGAIAAAIAAGDATAARDAMQAHLRSSAHSLGIAFAEP